MKRLAAMHDWPAFCTRACDPDGDGPVEVGRRQHDERVAAPELEDDLLAHRTGLGGHRPPGPHAAGQGDRGHPAVGDDGRHLVGADQQGLEDAVGGAGPAEAGPRAAGRCGARWGRASAGPTLPAMTAGARKRTTCHSGKFQGMMASTAPRGW